LDDGAFVCLDKLFNPDSVAVVGVSSKPDNPGTLLISSITEMGFTGSLYAVNPKYDDILGIPCYPSVSAIPEPPQLVFISVPPEDAAKVLVECADAGVLACVIITAGFSELQTEEGRRRERELSGILSSACLRVVGPNCMGVYSSSGGLALFGGMSADNGTVSCISQSGSIASILYLLGKERGICFSKIVSSGNELDLNCADFVEYFSIDESTEIVFAYLEQVTDPRRFMKAVEDLRGRKPVILWRSGLTESGAIAASSHTAAVAGREDIWGGFVRQTGVIEVFDLRDASDTLTGFYHIKEPAGRRVCVISPPGGIAVNAADAVERSRLELPRLAPSTRMKLGEFLPDVGTGLSNPVDMGFGAVVPGNMRNVIRTVDSDPCVDVIMVVGGAPAYREGDPGLMKMHSAEIREAGSVTSSTLVGIGMPSGMAFPYISELSWSGIPCFQTPADGCRVLSRIAAFHGL
jgi:acetate---CoA ligase (ADP-forming)